MELVNTYLSIMLPSLVQGIVAQNELDDLKQGMEPAIADIFGELDFSTVEVSLLEEKKQKKPKKGSKTSKKAALPCVEMTVRYSEPEEGKESETWNLNEVELGKFGELVTQSVTFAEEDVKTIEVMSAFDATKQSSFVKGVFNTVVDSQYAEGLLFLKLFGGVINSLTSERNSLPAWLMGRLEVIKAKALVQKTAIVEQQKVEKLEAFAVEIRVLEQINKIILGRSSTVNNLLAALKAGESLTVPDEKKMDLLRRKFVEENYEKTELAYPFLYFMVKEVVEKKLIPNGEWLENMLASFLKQVDDGFSLSDKQLDVLKRQYSRYKDLFGRYGEEYAMPSAQLIENVRQGKNAEECLKVLANRGIEYVASEEELRAVEML